MPTKSCLSTTSLTPLPQFTNPAPTRGRGFGFERPHKGDTNDWLTPPALLQRLGPFDLDPCGCTSSPWQTAATTYYRPQHDGLLEPWHGRCFLNPPYGRGVAKWAKRMSEHGNGIMLLYLRSDTQAWQKDILPLADAALMLEGRVYFRLPSGERAKGPTAPSVLLAYGRNNVAALRTSGLAGAFYGKAEMLPGIRATLL